MNKKSETKAHIVVIDPATNHMELDAYNRMSLYTHEARLTLHAPALFGMDSLYDMKEPLHGLVIMGSGASVYEPLDWQEKLRTWTSKQLESAIPSLGLCYGHQLLAQMTGAKIDFVHPNRQKLQGFRQIRLLQPGFWGAPDCGPLIVSHREHVTELGRNCLAIASSNEIPVEGFQHQTIPCWGFQSHPEAGAGFLRNQAIAIDHPADCFSFGARIVKGFIDMVVSKNRQSQGV